MASFQAILRQNAAFFDRDDHSTGTLTQMLGQEATAMSGLSGLNLGAILTAAFGIFAGCVLGYILHSVELIPALPTVGNWH